jgi:hypothetical protein
MKAKWRVIALLALSSMATLARAQDEPLAATAHKVIGAAQPVHLQAQIIGIDPATRTLTLRGSKGAVRTAVVTEEVKSFDKLRVGDRVDVLYKNALLVTAEKVTGADEGIRKRVDTASYAPSSGATGFQSSRQVEVLATVQGIDRKHNKITLRGPWQTGTFDLPPELAKDHLKPGDTVHAVFVSAAAVEVTPAGEAK